MSTSKAILFGAVLSGLAGCNIAVSHAPIIDHYKAATCVPVSTMPEPNSFSREWDAKLALTDGSHIIVTGTQSPGGRISVDYETTGRKLVAADAGDYIYPSDVRMNTRNDRLYVKASGLAGGVFQQTWLFEYDLRGQKLLERKKVGDSALPAECAAQ